MSAVDTAWLRMDASGNPMTIVGILTTATRFSLARLRRIVGERLLAFDRFRQRPVPDAFGAVWTWCPEVDLDHHVVGTTLPGMAGDAELADLAARLSAERLEPSRPLWQVHFIERFGQGSACVLRVHHCYGDGVAMVRVLESLCESTRRAGPDSRVNEPVSERPHRGWNLVDTTPSQAAALAMGFTDLLSMPEDAPTPLHGAAGVRRSAAWAQPLDLVEVRTIARVLGCTVNDVLMSALAGAIGAHLRDVHGLDTDDLVLRAAMPVDLRAPGEVPPLGNQFGLAFVELPVGERDPLQRVFRLHDTLAALKGSLQPATTLAALTLLGLLPAALQAPAVHLLTRKATVIASNVRGPRGTLRLCGQRIDRLQFWVPQAGAVGVGVSLLSYAGRVFFGIIADRDLLPVPASVASGFVAEFERLALATSTSLLASRQGRRNDGNLERTRARAEASDDGLAGST